MELDNLTPYQKLKSLGHTIPQEFSLFSTLILDRLVDLSEILNTLKSVQERLDYDLLNLPCKLLHYCYLQQKNFYIFLDYIFV